MPQVELPPEESSVNLTQLVPELDLIGDKGKDKKDESDEVRLEKCCEISSKHLSIKPTLLNTFFPPVS